MATKINLSIGRDVNGNKLVRLKSRAGGFSVQTDPRIFPVADRLYKGTIKDDADFEKVIRELAHYVVNYGTERQWNILRKLGVVSTGRGVNPKRNPKRKSKKSKQNRRRITFYRKFSGEDRYMGWRGNTQEGLWDAFHWLRQNEYQGNKANSIRIGKSVYRSAAALRKAEGL